MRSAGIADQGTWRKLPYQLEQESATVGTISRFDKCWDLPDTIDRDDIIERRLAGWPMQN